MNKKIIKLVIILSFLAIFFSFLSKNSCFETLKEKKLFLKNKKNKSKKEKKITNEEKGYEKRKKEFLQKHQEKEIPFVRKAVPENLENSSWILKNIVLPEIIIIGILLVIAIIFHISLFKKKNDDKQIKRKEIQKRFDDTLSERMANLDNLEKEKNFF